jgi:hypothetical protein
MAQRKFSLRIILKMKVVDIPMTGIILINLFRIGG